MKTILIFSNPFGYGPSGKALSVARYIKNHLTEVDVLMCGGPQLNSISGNDFDFIEVNDRDVASISEVLQEIKGAKYVISSQNRFAIKAAKEESIPCAFLDGLAWFWKDIPDDHFLADIVFWLNYPHIADKIPKEHISKVSIVHGITESSKQLLKKNNGSILFYIGGCNNPLTPLPTNYLDMVAMVFERMRAKGIKINAASDIASRSYLKKYPVIFESLCEYTHDEFLREMSNSDKFITNGGQTAVLEASNLEIPISFFLPINLSQMALVRNLSSNFKAYKALNWKDYAVLPKDFYNYTEKKAIDFLNTVSLSLLNDSSKMDLLCDDFEKILLLKMKSGNQKDFLRGLGSTGAEDIFKILKSNWNLR